MRAPNTTITSLQVDFLDPNKIQELVDQFDGSVGKVKSHAQPVRFAHCQTCRIDLNLCREALDVNGISPVLFAEAFALHMQKANRGTIAISGLVAGDRGRKFSYVCGVVKGLVTRYIQGLQHRLANTDVKVVLIKPGPTDTPMTA